MSRKYLLVLALAAGVASAPCFADDVGEVISATPVVQQVGVPRQVCSNQEVAVAQPKSGAGALMGALAGGAIGNQFGRGAGNAVSTMIGLVGGAMVGDRIEGAPPARMQTVRNCVEQTFVENRTVGYNVVYEYAGKQYTVQMPNNPGPTVALQISPLGSTSAQAVVPEVPAPAQVVSTAPMYVQPAPVVIASPPITYYYAQPYYYPPVGLNLGIGGWGHHHWH